MNNENHDYPSKEMEELYEAVLKLKTPDEVSDFIRDLLTIAEIKEFANRFQAAKLLEQGMPYAAIAKKLKISTTTVTRVALWLNHGMGGYKLVLSRLSKNK